MGLDDIKWFLNHMLGRSSSYSYQADSAVSRTRDPAKEKLRKARREKILADAKGEFLSILERHGSVIDVFSSDTWIADFKKLRKISGRRYSKNCTVDVVFENLSDIAYGIKISKKWSEIDGEISVVNKEIESLEKYFVKISKEV
jgi:hypothetical protein